MNKIKIDGFVLAIIVTVVLAYLFPTFHSIVPFDTIGSVGISLIFFFYGLKLSPDKIKTGLSNWKLHVVVQLATFLLYPILIVLFSPFFYRGEHEIYWFAFLFLAALPSTVSSSVVMTSIAKGNVPAAIFNASISGLIGILVTPLWIGLFLKSTNTDFDMGVIYLKLLVEILLPVAIGLLLQRYWGKYAQQHLKTITLFDKSVILIIVFKSFSESFEDHVFSSVHPIVFLLIVMAVIGSFFFVYWLIGKIAERLQFNREDTITAQFCGTKKSLVHGTVFSKVLFPASFHAGIILLPLMLFHAIQLFAVSIIAAKKSKEV
ncbi:MAG: bile acid:sodium symporter [Crocinitomicaceae bacterium]|nr:bile acid:sodium symporter [Crocinitomicaceae bacterium]